MTSHEHAGGSPPRLVDHLNARGVFCTVGLRHMWAVLVQKNSRETGDTVVG